MSYQALLATLWDEYIKRNPHANRIYQLFQDAAEQVVNDHIAFRTYDDPRINVDKLAQFFIRYGYEEKGEYKFPNKKLFAKHYEHQDSNAPKIFISELMTKEFSHTLQTVVKHSVDQIPEKYLHSENLLYAKCLWQPLSYNIYQTLLSESEYAAWMYAFGFCANHFTVNINHSTRFKEISHVNDFLLNHGVKLNTSGGLVKGTPEELLEQSSTLAEEVEVEFTEGRFHIPSCYYEFAKRYPLPNGDLYNGFIAKSADKIFESTNVAASR